VAADVRVFADAAALGDALAAEIVTSYERARGSFLLGCPGGRSLRTTYSSLAARQVDLGRLVVVMMDEYIGAPVDAHYSCRGFAMREIVAPLRLRDDQVWLPDPENPDAYDEHIAAAGGIDLFLLASGASDGHVALLPPGSPRDGRTSVVRLATTTRRDNLATFPEFRSVDDVPLHGISVGLGTIGFARAVRLVIHGADKRHAVARVLAVDRFDPAWPASIVHDCSDAEIWLDREAAP
jgi:glucosamine-6-phosphate deaminase